MFTRVLLCSPIFTPVHLCLSLFKVSTGPVTGTLSRGYRSGSHTRGDIRMRIMMRWRNWTSSRVLRFLYCSCEILDFKRYYNNAYRLRNTINVFLKFIEVLFVTRSTKPRFSLWKFCNTLIVTPDEAATALHWIFLCIINWVGTTPTIVRRMLLYTSY